MSHERSCRGHHCCQCGSSRGLDIHGHHCPLESYLQLSPLTAVLLEGGWEVISTKSKRSAVLFSGNRSLDGQLFPWCFLLPCSFSWTQEVDIVLPQIMDLLVGCLALILYGPPRIPWGGPELLEAVTCSKMGSQLSSCKSI